MEWTWDPNKNTENKAKHKISFETAKLVFDDPLQATRPDLYPYEQRYQTIGVIGHGLVLVVHTFPTHDQVTGNEVGRIISARRATTHERKAYAAGYF